MARPGLFPNGNPRPDYPEAYLEPAVVEGMPAMIGRDPRTIPVEQLEALGHTKQPLPKIVRINCIECVGGSEAEVRRCRLLHCPFWPYRMGSNPFNRRELTEDQREAMRERGQALAANRHGRAGSLDNLSSEAEAESLDGSEAEANGLA
jgi:hypothetical protein